MAKPKNYDFEGWATKNNLRCSDGRVIMQDAFKECDGKKVPLMWMHQHTDPSYVIGNAYLENRPEGVYTYGSFNHSSMAQEAKEALMHGDVESLSIYANQLVQKGAQVFHGAIREVSLVLAGANPGAFIENVIAHGDGFETTVLEDEAIIYTGEDITLAHADDADPNESDGLESFTEGESMEKETGALAHADEAANTKPSSEDNETVEDVVNSMSEKQRNVMLYLIGQAIESDSDADEDGSEDEGGNTEMKHNVFEADTAQTEENTLSHAEMGEIIGDAKRYGSMKDAFLAHGIDEIDYLFPDAKAITPTPEFIKRDTGWVAGFMNATHKTPFSRIKSVFADITEDEARARGYMKGKLKKEEVFGLLKRTTTPTTIYKKQKMDRDDVIDITDFDVIAWIKGEMRLMLDEEIARAALVGDGRPASSDDKINEQNIRPIWTDEELYTIQANFEVDTATATEDDIARQFIRTAIKARKDYKGSGNPTLFTTEDMLTNMLLMEDKMGRVIYEDVNKLATRLRVSKIVTVEVMENLTREVSGKNRTLLGIIVNPTDYNFGADRGGSVNMFEDFDIDYNQQKYLIETRCSGALVKPFSAIAIESYPKA